MNKSKRLTRIFWFDTYILVLKLKYMEERMAYRVKSVNLKKEVCKIVLKKNEHDGYYTFEEILQELESMGIKFEDGQSEKQLSYVLGQLFGEGKLLIDASFIIGDEGYDDLILDLKDFGVTSVIEKK